jgi:ApbE superfamily uncharacterized protein (UPF0280 family)
MNRFSHKFYREQTASKRWQSFEIKVETSDLLIRAGVDSSVSLSGLSEIAEMKVREIRKEIREHIGERESFISSLDPLEEVVSGSRAVSMMYRASERAGVGPMAAVAGTIAELVGTLLTEYVDEVIIENGGDIWMRLSDSAIISIYSGDLYFKERIALRIGPDNTPCGISTSSGKIGPSFSFGRADSATVISPDAALADAAATLLCNMVESPEHIEEAVNRVSEIEGVRGLLAIYSDKMAAWGDIELVDPLAGPE